MATFGDWDIGGCNCAVASISVQGCHEAYAGLTVSVYSSQGGTLLYSGTTDSTGTVHTTLGTGTYYVTIGGQSSRFAAYGQTLSLVAPAVNVISLSPATGYVCLGLGCLVPTTTTLTYTGPAGAHSLTWNGIEWASADGQVTFTSGTTASGTHVVYYSTETTCSSYTCPPSPTLNFFDGSIVTE